MFQNKVVFVTGSARGIGWETAKKFASAGATVLLNGHKDKDKLDAAAATLSKDYGVTARGLFGDVSSADNVRDWYQAIFKEFKRLDVLVNNAGILEDNLLGMISDDTIARTFAINTHAPILHTQAAARLMGRNGGGAIVNLTSIIGTNGNVGQAVYGASKAAVIGLTLSAAKELAPKNIRVNAVAPGFIDTDMTRGLPEDKFKERMASIRMGRIGAAQEVADAIVFLSSSAASYITGQVLGVDGGMLI